MHRLLHKFRLVGSTRFLAAVSAVAVATGAVTQQQRTRQNSRGFYLQGISNQERAAAAAAAATAVAAAGPTPPTVSVAVKSSREERFLAFASVEYNGEVYMTPRDFLESVAQDQPRQRCHRTALSKHELDKMLAKAPSRRAASTSLMRSLGTDGIISYPEYLFLLCTLANAKSGFVIAFSMIDRSRNQSVEKTEFATLNAMVSEWHRRSTVDGAEAEEPATLQDTTLMRHFFGRSGKECLNYQQFARFMSNLQYEVLEMEFLEYSRGLPTIAESDFARVLLRYTNLSAKAQVQYAQRVKEKLAREVGIGLEDYLMFFQFINSLQDLATALRMYALAGHAVTQEEFQRAVHACVGYQLAPAVVSTVFLLFDRDSDGSLSSEEFLGIVRDRLRRLNPKPRESDAPMGEFRQCVKRGIRKGGY